MLKHMLHSMQKVMTTDQAAEGLGEVELRDTVNAPVKEVHIYGKSVQAITTPLPHRSGVRSDIQSTPEGM